ncbi:MAG: ABC transporter ATP-binding protein [Desulfobacterales bacterium]|nr:MAG: ABC transporter ATP-binding protein [Desulfobacterales bacterium]
MISPADGHTPLTALVVQGITMDFVGLRALENVNLTLRQGEILGLIGPNGSGKTTMINVITGLLRPTAGRIQADGADITGKPPHKIAQTGVARTFQKVKLFRELTVFENVKVAAVSVGMPNRRAKEQAWVALEELGIEAWSGRIAGTLPYGHERKVEVARALAMNPKFILLDEPAAGMDEEESAALLQILTPIPEKKNLGMLIVDHDMNLIMRLCNRLHVLNYGKTIGEGTPEEVRRIPEVVEAYLGS